MADWMFESKDTLDSTAELVPTAKRSAAISDASTVDMSDSLANREMIRDLQQWLAELCQGAKVPALPTSADELSALSRIRNRVALAAAQTDVLIADAKQKKLEYAAETKRITELLSSLGLAPSDGQYSSSGLTSIQMLSHLAETLQMHRVDTLSYLDALGDATNLQAELQDAVKAQQRASSSLQRRTQQALAEYTDVKRALARIEEERSQNATIIAQRDADMSRLKAKKQQYELESATLKSAIAGVGLDRKVTHQSLVALAAELTAIQSKTTPLDAVLAAYHDLPPDLSLAKLKVEQARQQLSALEDDLAREIDALGVTAAFPPSMAH